MQTAEVDERNAGFLHLGDQSRVVLVAGGDAFIHDFGYAEGVHSLLGFVGETLTIGGLVVNDSNLAVLEVVGDVLAATSPCWSSRPQTRKVFHMPRSVKVGLGSGRGDFEDAVFGIDFRSRIETPELK